MAEEQIVRVSADEMVKAHGDFLYAVAKSRLRNAEAAEDAVQEAFLAALRQPRNQARFADERAWLIGILRHKIADHFRKVSRIIPATDAAFDGEADLFVESHFDAWATDQRPCGVEVRSCAAASGQAISPRISEVP